VHRSGAGMKMRKGQPSSSTRVQARQGVRGRFEEGIRCAESRTNLRSGRSVPARHVPSGTRRTQGSMSASFARKAKGKRWWEARRLSSRSRIRRLAAIARASSYCRSHQAVLRLRETRPRQRAGRKPERGKRRVDGSLAKSGTPRARKRSGRTGRKGNGSSELGDPQSRERPR
jgi:hypothetical protein